MTIKPVIKSSGLCAILATLNYCVPQKSEELALQVISDSHPKNVIYILSDDHRYDFMGFTGKVPWLKTPNLDRLATPTRTETTPRDLHVVRVVLSNRVALGDKLPLIGRLLQ